MIVLFDLTMEAMQDAVQRLFQEGFFEHLVPVNRNDLDTAGPYSWPPERAHRVA